MENGNNLTLREQIILKLLDKSLEYGDIFDMSDARIAHIHRVADKLSTPPGNSNAPGSDIPLDTPIEYIRMPKTGRYALYAMDVRTIGDLIMKSRYDIRRARGLGGKSMNMIEDFMERHNLRFADQL